MPNRTKLTLADLRMRLTIRLAVAPRHILKALGSPKDGVPARDELRHQLIEFLTLGWDSLDMDITGPAIIAHSVPPTTGHVVPLITPDVDSNAVGQQPCNVCNLYNLKAARSEVVGMFGAADRWHADMGKDYVAPGLPGPVIVQREGERISGLMDWGVPNGGKLVTNVRNLESPFWRNMLDRPQHRCLVPVTEFQEWSAAPDPGTGKKRAYWFSLPSRPLFAFAGIWRKVEGQPRFAFLTTEPNAMVGAIHPKAMPVILDEGDYGQWLSAPWDDAAALATAYPSQLMTVAN